MKNFKYILSAFALLLVMVVPFCLTGCTKHYKINITVAEGLGDVRIGLTNEDTKSLVGENEVEEGSTFEFSCTPFQHYEVGYIKVDGSYIYNIEWAENTYNPTDLGDFKPRIPNVDADHSIVVGFTPKTYKMTFFYVDPDTIGTTNVSYIQLAVNSSPYVVEGNCETTQTITGLSNEFKIYNKENELVEWTHGDTIMFKNDYALYIDKTEAELKEILGITQTPSQN